jgi:hypothetical protein
MAFAITHLAEPGLVLAIAARRDSGSGAIRSASWPAPCPVIDSTGHDIGSLQIIGVKGLSGPFFSGSYVTANTIGTLVLNDVNGDNTIPTAFGITAHKATSCARKVKGVAAFPTKTNLLGTGVAAVADVVGKYSLTLI